MTDNSNGAECVQLDRLCSKGKSSLRQKDVENDGPYLVYGASGVVGRMSVYQNEHPYVAVVKDGAGVGRAMLCAGKTSVLGTMQALLPKEGTNLSYLLHLVRSLKLGEDYSGSTIPHIYFKDYGKRMVPVPTVSRQAVIADTLDSIERLKSSCDAQCSKLDELVKSRFVEMFGDPQRNPGRYDTTMLGEVLSVRPSNGLYKPQKDYVVDGSGVPIVRIDSFRREGPDYPRLKRLRCNDNEISRYGLHEGDIVINRVNSVGSMGKTMLINNLPCAVVFESNMMRLHSDEEIMSPSFLCAQMTSDFAKTYFESNAKRAIGQASINQTDVINLPVLVPPLSIQKNYSDFVTHVDKLRTETQRQKQDLQTLYDSLAQEYFAM